MTFQQSKLVELFHVQIGIFKMSKNLPIWFFQNVRIFWSKMSKNLPIGYFQNVRIIWFKILAKISLELKKELILICI